MKTRIKLITLAAGLGKRLENFDKKNKIKPLKKIFGESLIKWSLKSYHFMFTRNILEKSDLYFVIQKEHNIKYKIKKILIKEFGDKINVIELSQKTSGPAESAYIAIKKSRIKNKTIIINDCDHYFNGNVLTNYFYQNKNNTKYKNLYSGIINTFDPEDSKPNWSYLKYNKKKKLLSIKEKDKQLAKLKKNGVVGSYCFFNSNNFLKEYEKLSSKKIKNEIFISHICNEFLKKKKNFKILKTFSAFPLGTISQIKGFQKIFKKQVYKLYPEPKTLLFDLDGVLTNHDKGYHSSKEKYSYPLRFIKKNIDFLKSEYERGSIICILTARGEEEKSRVIKDFNKSKIPYHKFLFGISGGTRILINDKKPNLNNYKVAISISTNRNKNIIVDEKNN